MSDQVRDHLTSPSIWTRFLYMVLFAIAYSIAEVVIVLIAVFQFFAALFTGRVNEPLLRFGNNLSRYVYQIFRYQTFNSEERPFPFSDWPDEPIQDNDWLKEPEAQSPQAAASAASAAPASAPATATPASAPTEPDSDAPAAAADASEQDVDDSGQSGDDYRVR